MEHTEFDKNKIIKYWTDSSDDDYETMLAMFNNKRYSWSLFVGHLMIEKLLKASHVKVNDKFPPLIHNLLRLAEICKLELTDDQRIFFATVTAFNINARYDDFKMSFQQKCTPEFTAYWFEEIKMKREWIKQLIIQ